MILFIMDCIICLTETNEKSLSNCKCKYNIHKNCYIKFLKKSIFVCPICRKPKNKIIKNNNNQINFLVKFFLTIYLIFITIIYLLLIYLNYKIFNKLIIKNIFVINI